MIASEKGPQRTMGSPLEEQSRACYPDEQGYVDRDGVQIFWERYGEGETTVLLLPTWTLVHSRIWKEQIAYLARHFRVVTFDPRGNGRSDRLRDRTQFAESEFAADALAVMDATGTEQAVIVGFSRGSQRGMLLATEHPERVIAAAFIGPWFPASRLGGLRWRIMANPRFRALMFRPPLVARWWGKFNGVYWRTNYPDFVDWFIRRMFVTEHSTKQIEDAIGWAHETDPRTLFASATAERAAPATRSGQLALARRVRCPVLVISARNDKISAHADAKALAAATGGDLLSIRQGGHAPHARKPVPVNAALREFVERAGDRGNGRSAHVRTAHRPARAGKRAIYVSSPIGLGHVRRDIAIADELRALHPGLEIEWLAQNPVTAVLEAHGESIHPISTKLASESRHFQRESHGHELHCFQALRRMDEILLANFMVFHDLVRQERFDVWIGDEAWDLDYYLHENPGLKTAPFAWLTDFVGYLPTPGGGEREAFLTADYNAEMIGHIDRNPSVRDRAIFVGDRDDIVPDSFGDGLPLIRDWTDRNFSFSGYVTGFEQEALGERAELRDRFGYGEDERICVVSVGGSGIGTDLLRRVIAAYPEALRQVEGLRMVVVAGPRIDPKSLPAPPGVEVHGYVDGLFRHLAACDLAVVQGGLTTSMELAASRTPFIYFPLKNHFEQEQHVDYRLKRYKAGRRLDYETATTGEIATAIAAELRSDVDYLPVAEGGAAQAAKLIAELF